MVRWLVHHQPGENLAHCDGNLQDAKTFHGPHDERTLPFLLRKMRVEHGYDVPGLVLISSTE